MKSATALSRPLKHGDMQDGTTTRIDAQTALKIAQSWAAAQAAGDAMMSMATGIMPWRASVPMQSIASSIVADMLPQGTRIVAINQQPYLWMQAAGTDLKTIACIHLGKQFPQNVLTLSAEDAATAFEKDVFTITALHIDSSSGWNDVRTISAAAVRAETPMLMVITASVSAPEGVSIDIVNDWSQAAIMLRQAVSAVQTMGTIRVVALEDMPVPQLEAAMMEVAQIAPENWQNIIAKENDGAEMAITSAYQAPVESF